MQILKDIPNCPKPVGPYSPAVKANGLVFTAGQIGLNPETGNLVSGGIEAETKQVFSNLRAVLKAAGSGVGRMTMVTIFLSDISHMSVVNELYKDFVDSNNPPARQTIAVKDLPRGCLIEVSVIAVAD